MLRTRVLTALVGIPVLIFFIYLGGYWYALAVLTIAGIGLKEYFFLMGKKAQRGVEFCAYLFLPLALWAVFRENPMLILTLWVLAFTAFGLLPVFFPTKAGYRESALSYWGIIYTVGLASYLLAVRLLPQGFAFTLLLFLMVWAEDILAYFVGSLLGKRPLAPKISPHKTWEGTIAGITGSALAGLFLAMYFDLPFLNELKGALLGLVTGSAATLGDLSQSALKRSAGVKDSGHLLPGHGGILDRFDSLFFAAPFFYLLISYVLNGA